MSNTVTLSTTKIDKILAMLAELNAKVADLTKKIEVLEPSYGSDEWWEWSEKKAREDIKAGRVTTINNKTELKEFFNSLKSS